MVFSSFVGCIDTDEDDATITESDTNLGNVLVSTYHVGELVKAVGGDRITVEIISPSNVPVHDYEPSAADLIKLQETDLFFYHGLNLEPWVDSTVSSLGSDAPLVVRTHAMPSGENTLDYQSMLLSKICETLNEDAYEAVTLSEYEHKASDVTIHAEDITHKVSFPEIDDEDNHDEDNHDEEDHDGHDHDEHGHDEHGHDEHDGHEEHNHAEAEKLIESPTGCPADTVVSIFHLEEGEYVLEFEYEDSTDFDMVVLKMAGGHAHHDHHGHGEDHDDHGEDHDDHGEDHDEHGEDHCDDDHDGHGDEEDHGDEDDHDSHDHDEHGHDEHGDEEDDEVSAACVLENFDTNEDSHLSWDEFWHAWTNDTNDDHGDDSNGSCSADADCGEGQVCQDGQCVDSDNSDDNETHDGDGHHDDHEGEMVALMEVFNESDENNDQLLNLNELEHFIYLLEGDDDHEAGYATIHIEEEGDYGFALPSGIEYFILMGEGGHDDHSDHGHGDHGDEHAVCHDTTNHVNTEHDNEADCEAAGHMWMEDHDEGPCHDMNTHNSTEHDNEADCEAAGHLWMGDHSDGGSEIAAGGEEEAFEYDPHSWLSPVAYKAQLNVVLESLVTVFPDGEADFRANAEAYSAELDKLDLDYTAAFGDGGTCEVKNVEKTVVANHNAYAYISQRYDIEILTVHGLDPEGEPSAADIAEVVEQIKEKSITVLYVEEYTDTSSVDSIAQQTGVTIEILYTMELPPKNSEDNYLTLMGKNLDSLVTGMGC